MMRFRRQMGPIRDRRVRADGKRDAPSTRRRLDGHLVRAPRAGKPEDCVVVCVVTLRSLPVSGCVGGYCSGTLAR